MIEQKILSYLNFYLSWMEGVNFINVYVRIFRTKFWRQSQNVTRKSCWNDVRTKNLYVTMLMKLTKGRTSMTSFSDNELMSLPFSTEIWISFFLRSNFLMTFFCRLSNVRFKTAIEKWLSCHNAIGVSQSQQYYFQRKPLNVITFMNRGQFYKCSKKYESLWNHTFIKTIL